MKTIKLKEKVTASDRFEALKTWLLMSVALDILFAYTSTYPDEAPHIRIQRCGY